MRIYYAHHRWKYGTRVEKYELDLIRSAYPEAEIFNPATDLDVKHTEAATMAECLRQVRNSDLVIFSSMDGVIGKGAYEELEEAKNAKIPILYIHQNNLFPERWFCWERNTKSESDRIYGLVYTFA